jgi:hypothetical protein
MEFVKSLSMELESPIITKSKYKIIWGEINILSVYGANCFIHLKKNIEY